MELPPPPTYEETFKLQKSASPLYNEKFRSKRTMPIVYSFRSKAALLFPSEGSLDSYKHKIFEREASDLEDGDMPLFQFTETSSFKRMFGKPSYVIFKYEMKRLKEASGEKPLSMNKTHGLYKVPFCSISRRQKKGRMFYTLKYPDEIQSPDHELIKDNDVQLTYSGTINGTSFQYTSPTGKIDELILTMDSGGKPGSFQEGVTGVYTTEGRDRVPRKFSKFATLVVREDSNQPSPSTKCISPNKLPLLCQGLLINHFIRPIIRGDDMVEPHPNKSEIWDLLESE